MRIQSFSSPRRVAIPTSKSSVFPSIVNWVPTRPKVISTMLNPHNLIQILTLLTMSLDDNYVRLNNYVCVSVSFSLSLTLSLSLSLFFFFWKVKIKVVCIILKNIKFDKLSRVNWKEILKKENKTNLKKKGIKYILKIIIVF